MREIESVMLWKVTVSGVPDDGAANYANSTHFAGYQSNTLDYPHPAGFHGIAAL